MPTTAELLLLADQRRPRTQQLEIGPSDLGTCDRRVGYKLARTPHVNKAGSVQAAIGTAVHDAIADVMREIRQDGDLVEHEVEFLGVKGRLDRYEAATKTVSDTKTTSRRWLDHILLLGPEHSHIWQITWYAAGCIQAGIPVEYVSIEYLCRDTGEEYVYRQPFNPQDLKDAVEWLKLIRDSDVEDLPRRYEPDSEMCKGCPFGGEDGGECWSGHVPGRDLRSVLYVENPDGDYWSNELVEAREAAKAANARAKRATGALSAVVNPGGVPTKVGGHWWRYDAANRLRRIPDPTA